MAVCANKLEIRVWTTLNWVTRGLGPCRDGPTHCKWSMAHARLGRALCSLLGLTPWGAWVPSHASRAGCPARPAIPLPPPPRYQGRLLQLLLQHSAPHLFSYQQSTFRVQKSKAGTGRVVAYREMGLTNRWARAWA